MKRTIRLTESELKHMISESVRKVLNEVDFKPWVSSSNSAVEKAVELLSDAAIKQIVGDDFSYLKNATDLQECYFDDLQMFFSIDNSDVWDVVKEPFSIKEFNDEYDYFSTGEVFEDFIKDHWQDVLPPDLVDKIYDRKDVASIIYSDYYGGGGYEAMRDVEIQTCERIAQIIKQKAQS